MCNDGAVLLRQSLQLHSYRRTPSPPYKESEGFFEEKGKNLSSEGWLALLQREEAECRPAGRCQVMNQVIILSLCRTINLVAVLIIHICFSECRTDLFLMLTPPGCHSKPKDAGARGLSL